MAFLCCLGLDVFGLISPRTTGLLGQDWSPSLSAPLTFQLPTLHHTVVGKEADQAPDSATSQLDASSEAPSLPERAAKPQPLAIVRAHPAPGQPRRGRDSPCGLPAARAPAPRAVRSRGLVTARLRCPDPTPGLEDRARPDPPARAEPGWPRAQGGAAGSAAGPASAGPTSAQGQSCK
ncbi:uncharacterized protein LOC132478464 [Mesoplodon densirostris]|uniref:uncharacterized protein LOC132478464 n=1 Tax=Mesoplodon densirostris TaxID=48708 RepID=UPI0028DCA3C7|nr:uncharacterized protein LOC132478464 [Mesoplodon densirostris]